MKPAECAGSLGRGSGCFRHPFEIDNGVRFGIRPQYTYLIGCVCVRSCRSPRRGRGRCSGARLTCGDLASEVGCKPTLWWNVCLWPTDPVWDSQATIRESFQCLAVQAGRRLYKHYRQSNLSLHPWEPHIGKHPRVRLSRLPSTKRAAAAQKAFSFWPLYICLASPNVSGVLPSALSDIILSASRLPAWDAQTGLCTICRVSQPAAPPPLRCQLLCTRDAPLAAVMLAMRGLARRQRSSRQPERPVQGA